MAGLSCETPKVTKKVRATLDADDSDAITSVDESSLPLGRQVEVVSEDKKKKPKGPACSDAAAYSCYR